MLKALFSIVTGFLSIFKLPIYFFITLLALFFMLIGINLIILHRNGFRFKKGHHRKYKGHGFFRKLLIDAPKMIAKDIITKEPDFFDYQGFVVFVGRQGWGKSIALVEFLSRMRFEYPLAKCKTNMSYAGEDESLGHWKDMIKYNNGKEGVIIGMDETQNWFSSNDSRNFPPEMLQEITQNRKQRRIILGTSQSFNLLAKAIRTQTTEVRECITLMRCITIVRRREPILNSEGDVIEYKNRGFYWFVQTDEMRQSYDTWKVIERLTKVGFQDKDYLSSNNININVEV